MWFNGKKLNNDKSNFFQKKKKLIPDVLSVMFMPYLLTKNLITQVNPFARQSGSVLIKWLIHLTVNPRVEGWRFESQPDTYVVWQDNNLLSPLSTHV